jgi:hypothetical protein
MTDTCLHPAVPLDAFGSKLLKAEISFVLATAFTSPLATTFGHAFVMGISQLQP